MPFPHLGDRPTMAPVCCFVVSWRGRCGKAAAGTPPLCADHSKLRCASCGAKATHDCDHTGQLVCGAPLCADCTGTTDPAAGWGFMGMGGHTHARMPSAPPIPEAPASASPEAGTPKETPMALIDIKAVEAEAQSTINKERADKAKALLLKQLRAVESAREILRGEELKLADVKRQIEDGTF